MNVFRAATRALRDDVLARADVVVTTLFSTSETSLRCNPQPILIAVDEAAKIAEPELWPVLAFYHPRAWLLVGDQLQLRPTIPSSPDTRTTLTATSCAYRSLPG